MSDTTSAAPAEKLTKKQLKADHPTWCPACGDFAVLASFFNVVQKLGIPHEKICVRRRNRLLFALPLFRECPRHSLSFTVEPFHSLPESRSPALISTFSFSAVTATDSPSGETTSTTPHGRTSTSPTSSWTISSTASPKTRLLPPLPLDEVQDRPPWSN